MRRPSVLWLAGVAAASAALASPSPTVPRQCEVPPELAAIEASLPHLAARLRARQPVTIVAIGGSSTRGAAAGDPERAYPQRLQQALAARFPQSAIAVVNQGVPRQSAQQMLDRFASDVLPVRPALVIWETGTTDAVRGIGIDDFAAALQAGIDELRKRAIDIILVDMQFSHKTTTLIDFDSYLNALHRVGEINGLYVFPRFEMMRYWSEQHMFNFDDVPKAEHAQLAAKVYDCLGRNLARAIRRAVP